ncbi:hypothetical protein [Streptomyces flaveolus]|uniref:hypothetical protein n=1 Tax=Streptomyces flaveolus TaxID=67297 RepID=UPI00342DEACB
MRGTPRTRSQTSGPGVAGGTRLDRAQHGHHVLAAVAERHRLLTAVSRELGPLLDAAATGA